MLWTDYFKPPHFEKYPELHTLVNEATKLAGATGTKGALDADVAQELLDKIDEIDRDLQGDEAGLSPRLPHRARPRQAGPVARPQPSGSTFPGPSDWADPSYRRP